MKRILTSLLMAVGITGPFVAHLGAQTNRQVADIPFAFVVCNRTLPAGQYSVTQMRASSPIFTVRDTKGHGVFVQLNQNETGKPYNPSLTFACYGKECVLAKITPPNDSTAYALSQSAVEKNLTHKLGMASMVSIKLKAH
jgi:hypothetical protein